MGGVSCHHVGPGVDDGPGSPPPGHRYTIAGFITYALPSSVCTCPGMPLHGGTWVPDVHSDDACAYVESLRWAGYCVDFQPTPGGQAPPSHSVAHAPAGPWAPSPGTLPAPSTDFLGGGPPHYVEEAADYHALPGFVTYALPGSVYPHPGMPPHGSAWVPDANSDDVFAFVESLRWAGYCVDFQPTAPPGAAGASTGPGGHAPPSDDVTYAPAGPWAPSPGALPAPSTDFLGGAPPTTWRGIWRLPMVHTWLTHPLHVGHRLLGPFLHPPPTSWGVGPPTTLRSLPAMAPRIRSPCTAPREPRAFP